ncbi:hypothetical protein [Nonomuraea sp. NPDC050783]|uniref:hypothetical protein n=1 Tax=Nonomuraea sp. NPDC050783 TaxID=3154634 RepID=UPI0034665FE8
MTTPPNQQNRLIIPGRPTAAQGTQQLHLANSGGSVTRTVQVPPAAAAATRTDPGFFKRLVTGLNPLRQSTRGAMMMSGLGAAALALDVAATLNLGNPFLFYDRRETWKEMSGSMEGSRTDLWRGYFDQVAPNWRGSAAEALTQYIRFNADMLFDKLGKVGQEMSGAMHNQFKEVLEYDLSVFGLYATSAPVLRSLAAMSTTHPVARVALMTQVGVFTTALGNLVKQFADVYNSYEGDLNKLELKLTDLKGAFYKSGDPELGARDLGLTPTIDDPGRVDDMWVPKAEGPVVQ